MSDIFVIIFLFALGAGVGSFVAMAVERLHKGKPLAGRSRCDKCHKPLGAMEMVPIVGWLILRGRCQKCHKKIGVTSLLTEIALGGLFAASYLVVENYLLLPLWLVILSGLIFLLIYDARYRTLPNRVIYPVMAILVIFWIVQSVISEQNIYAILINLIYAMVPVAGVYGLVFALSRGKMVGLGDVKLGIIVGFLLPWQGSVVVLFLANIMAMIIFLPMLLSKKIKATDQLPLGPFLVVATIIMVFVMKLVVDFF